MVVELQGLTYLAQSIFMHKYYISTLFALSLLLSLRCQKDNAVTLFDMVYVFQVEIPPALNTVQTHFITYTKVPTRIETLLAEHNKTLDAIGKIIGHNGFLEITIAPEDLSFFREVFVEIADGGTMQECFYTPDVPFNTGNRVVMVGTIANFKKLLTDSAMNMRLGFRLRQPSPSSMNLQLRLTFKAQA